MKRNVFLIVSLGLNLALAAGIFWAGQRRADAMASTEPASTVVTHKSEPVVAPAVLVQTNEVVAPFHWSEIESEDYLVYQTNLRAIGCPEQRVQDILIADVDALFAARLRDYVAPLQNQFWELAAQPQQLEANLKSHQTALREMEREREQIFQVLFNENNPRRSWRNQFRDTSRTATRNRQLDFLDESKRASVLTIEAELSTAMNEARQAKFARSRDEIQQQRRAKENEARDASEEKLRGVLTAEEFAEYKLRNSPGPSVRQQLARMTLSAEEARSIAQVVAAKAGQESQLATSGAKNEVAQARAELEQRTQEQIKQLLGETRYAEYQRASDWRYNQAARIVERLELPEPTAVAIYQAQVEAEKIVARLRADVTASAEEREAALVAVRAEAERTIRQQLGAANFNDYANNSRGWLDNLSRPNR